MREGCCLSLLCCVGSLPWFVALLQMLDVGWVAGWLGVESPGTMVALPEGLAARSLTGAVR